MNFLTLFIVVVMASLCGADSDGGSAMGDVVTDQMPTNATRRIRGPGRRSVCDVDGRGGVIRLSSDDSFSSDKTVEVSLASIQEVGKAPRSADRMGGVGELSGARSAFDSFSHQNFELTEPINTTYSNLSVTSFGMTKMLRKNIRNQTVSIGNVTIMVYIFNEAGMVANGDETTEVMAGTLKFNVALEGFQFCNASGSDCNGKEGSALDVSISVKGEGGQKVMKAKRTRRPNNLYYSVGKKAAIGLAKMVRVDGQWREMPDGFPMMDTQGSNSMLKLRFDKFESEILYDPTIDLDLDDLELAESGNNGSVDDRDAASAVSSFGIVAILAASLIQVIF